MAQYYRDWNLVVHEWLYAYVYRDIAVVSFLNTVFNNHLQQLKIPNYFSGLAQKLAKKLVKL